MIGIFAKPDPVIEEFFELFKTRWAYYQYGNKYDIVIADDDYEFIEGTRLLIIQNNKYCNFDAKHELKVSRSKGGVDNKIEVSDTLIPIFGEMLTFNGTGVPLIRNSNNEIPVVQLHNEKFPCVRIGYNIFEEVAYLLAGDQPRELAGHPTIDCHIEIIRRSIINTGIALIEIPPKPAGYNFIA